jgi:precorrin-4 methylase
MSCLELNTAHIHRTAGDQRSLCIYLHSAQIQSVTNKLQEAEIHSASQEVFRLV